MSKPKNAKPFFLFGLVFSVLSFALYTYNPNHWLHIPETDEIIAITASLDNVYVTVSDAILVFDRRELKFSKSFTKIDGIPEAITITAYDRLSDKLVIISQGLLTFFSPFLRLKTDYPLSIQPHSLGIGERNICFLTKTEKYIWERERNRLKRVKAFPDTNIYWYGEKPSEEVRNYLFLTPYQIMDEDLVSYPMTRVFSEGKRLWVGVKNYGLLVYDRNTGQKIKEFRLGLKAKRVREILKREDGLWFLGDYFFIRLKEDLERWEYFSLRPGKIFQEKNPLLSSKFLDQLRTNRITAIAGEKELYFATPDKFYHYDPKTENLEEIPLPAIQKIIPIPQDTVLLLTTHGLFLYQTKTKELKELIDPKGELKFGVFSGAVNNFGKIFGIRGGFLKLDNSGNWERFIIPGVDLSFPIYNLVAAGDYLFLATKEGLFAFQQRNNQYQILKEKEGLLSSHIHSLYLDTTALWMATEKGISRLLYKNLF